MKNAKIKELSEAQQDVLEVIRAEKGKVAPDLIHKRTGLVKSTIQTAISRLMEEGLVEKVGYGKYGLSDQTAGAGQQELDEDQANAGGRSITIQLPPDVPRDKVAGVALNPDGTLWYWFEIEHNIHVVNMQIMQAGAPHISNRKAHVEAKSN